MIQRQLEKHLLRLAKQYPVVTLTGPRQSGKTTICKKVFPEYEYVNLEDLETRQFAFHDPKGFLNQFQNGVIIDEIQRIPDLTSLIQVIVDNDAKSSKHFILTGSQQFEVINAINQSLAGRSAIARLLPFSYTELYTRDDEPSMSTILYTGFYPRIHDKNLNPTEALSFYLTTYIERDLRQLINIRELSTFERFLKLCAANIGQLTNYSQLANDCGVNQATVKSWLSLLKASYIIFELQPHFKNFHKRLTKSSKIYFYDIGLASYLLGITNQQHIEQHPLKGFLFENFIVCELIKNRYNNVRESNLFFFRDHVGNEVDVILDYGQKLIPIEIKSSQTMNSAFLKGLNYYKKISAQPAVESFLIYGGSNSSQQNGTTIFDFHNLADLYRKLEEV
ncbi:MAG: hypothetical protein A2X78_00990 [Gammaproteobacteria bacterium GWE2_37_16]|nr:MAG: hypothetical protein A2X78_00990 [Gammaproteobacteria bacterium GWE2_37_16]